ncbi:MAG: hypothetical protein QG641_2086 [Candidatus Poribacteria bacterium]|nr:hypothetical protein [Candidatus Poribacteria bacterium]
MQYSALSYQNSGRKYNLYEIIACMLFIICFFSIGFTSYAQEAENGEDKAIDLPPVKIEIIDATQLTIPKEKFNGLAEPDSDIYIILNPKERLWYLPSTSVPEKIQGKSVKPGEDFFLALSAYLGLPPALTYQMLLVKGFGKSQVLVDFGRSSLLSDRTAKLTTDSSKKQDGMTINRFNGLYAYQTDNSNIRTGLNYKAKGLNYLDLKGEKYPNDRSVFNLSFDWDQEFLNGIESSVNADIAGLNMKGPLSSDSDDALDLKTDLTIRTFLSPSVPIDTGLKIEYFAGNGSDEKYKETILKLYIRDNRIRLWPFVLGTGIELAIDTHKSSLKDDWKTSIYPNPYARLTSQIGSAMVLQFGLERYILKQSLEDTYLDKDYVRYNPGLSIERGWNIQASLKYNLMKTFNAKVGVFDKEISNLAIFNESKNTEDIISWFPESLDNTHIFGISSGWELLLLDERLKQNFEYVHEFPDENILYRPKDKGVLNLTYFASYDFDLSLSSEFYGLRYINKKDATLPGYILWKPKISKSFGKNAKVSLEFIFYTGKDNYQEWNGYSLPKNTVDFGLTVKF